MFTVYKVISKDGRTIAATFTHYGKALSFANKIGYNIQISKSYNIFKYIYDAI